MKRKNYIYYFIDYKGDIEKALLGIEYVILFEIFPMFAVILVEEGKEKELLEKVENILSMEENRIFVLSKMEEYNKKQHATSDSLKLKYHGDQVMVGLIGTGVDYLDEDLQDEQGESRILYLWDQELIDEKNSLGLGKEFSQKDINKALELNNSGENPYTVVPDSETSSYGTYLCKVIGGKSSQMLNKCKFSIVKLKNAEEDTLIRNGVISLKKNIYDTYHIIKALEYLRDIKEKTDKPMIVYLPIENNLGSREGTTALDIAIYYYSQIKDFIIVTTTGAEGDGYTHNCGRIKDEFEEEIDIVVSAEENKSSFLSALFTNRYDKMALSICSPNKTMDTTIDISNMDPGEIINSNGKEGNIEVQFYPSTRDSILKEIIMRFKDVSSGLWRVKIKGVQIFYGNYDFWLSNRELSDYHIMLRKADTCNTLTIPSASRDVISVMTYSYLEKGLRVLTGKPYYKMEGQFLKPILSQDIRVAINYKNNDFIVGGVALSGVVVVALIGELLQWAVVDENKVSLSLEDIRIYLIKSGEEKIMKFRCIDNCSVVSIEKFNDLMV